MSDHNTCRKKVCVICLRKGKRVRNLSNTDIKSIKDYVNANYNVDDPDSPCGLCNGCYLLLNKKCNGADIVLPVQQFKPDRKKLLHSAVSCDCSLCNVAKAEFNALRKLKKKKLVDENNKTNNQSLHNMIY